MPELPEVEVVRAGLAPAVSGALITSVEVFDRRALKRHSPLRGDFEAQLTDRRIHAAVRRGKFLWFPLGEAREQSGGQAGVQSGPVAAGADGRAGSGEHGGPEALVTHLGMSGQMLLREPGQEDRLTRIRLSIEHPTLGEYWVNFVDQRLFGGMAVDPMAPTADGGPGGSGAGLADGLEDGPDRAGLADVPDRAGLADGLGRDGLDPNGDRARAAASRAAALIPGQVAHIARDPLDPRFSDAAFYAGLARRGTGIKRALLDQTLISGIGNIYADEALWLARVHYERPASSLSRPRARALLEGVRSVLRRALAEGGTSFDSQYVNVNGNAGYFARSLNAYGQQGRECARCGTTLLRESFMNRGSHFCPRCQRKPQAY